MPDFKLLTNTGAAYDFPREVEMANGTKRPIKGCTKAEYDALWEALPIEKRLSGWVPLLQRAGFCAFGTDEYVAVVGNVRTDDAQIITSIAGPCPPHNWQWRLEWGDEIRCTKCGEVHGTMTLDNLATVKETGDAHQ
jgi:hypothetical protein